MKILKNYLYNIIYQIFIILVPIITVPYISRILGPEGVGLNAYTNSIISYFVLIANLGLSLYGNRTIAYYRNDKIERSKRFIEICILKLIMMSISFLFLFIFLNIKIKYSYFLWIQSIQIIAVGIDISWFFTGIEDFKKTVTRNVMVKLFSVIMIFVFVKQTEDLHIYILINALSALIGNMTLWTYMKKNLVLKKYNLNLKVHIFPVLSLFLPQIATTIFVSLNRLMLGNLSTISQTGYFDNADKIVRICLSLVASIGTVTFPRIANFHKEKKKYEVNRYVNLTFNSVNLISFPIVIGIIIISKPFSNLFFGSTFQGINQVLSILALELIFMGWSSVIGQQYMVAINKVRGLTISMFCSVAICFLGSLILLPHYGAKGAAIMSVISEATIALIQFLFIRKYLNLKLLFNEIWKYALSSIIMFVSCYFINLVLNIQDFYLIIIDIIIGVFFYVLLLFFFKVSLIKEILRLFNFNKRNGDL